MKIYGDLTKIKLRQTVGIFSLTYNQWIIGTVQDVSDKITVVSSYPRGIFSFNYSGEIFGDSTLDNTYFLVYCAKIPDKVRYGDSRTLFTFIVDSYSDWLMRSADTE